MAIQRALETQRQVREAGLGDECYRLVDRDVAAFVAERYGPCLWVAYSRATPPTPPDMTGFAEIADLAGCRYWMIDEMPNRGSAPNASQRTASAGFPARWEATEAAATYQLRCDTGRAPGLFLDQRQNRAEVAASSAGARVLNLFAYTCSFSVVAAMGGAAQVVSVDISGAFLEWGRENFRLNGIERPQDVFWKGDARDFLTLAKKRRERFDLIVLDPPTFSRSRKQHFHVRHELPSLAKTCFELLSSTGRMLVCTNLSAWSSSDLRKHIAPVVPGAAIHEAALPIGITDFGHAAKCLWIDKSGTKNPSSPPAGRYSSS